MQKIISLSIALIFGLTISLAQTIAGGNGHSLAVCSDNTAWAWGLNSQGQLGNGNNTDTNHAVQVSFLTGITAVAGVGNHSLALKNDSTVWGWGRNSSGELGNGTNIDTNLAVQVNSLTGITAIAGGGFHSLVLKNDSTVWAYGSNVYGQLGDGTNTASNVPVQVSSLTGIIAVSGGWRYSLALKSDSTVWAWGESTDGSGNSSNIPVQVSSLTGIIAIAAGNFHSLAVKNDGTVWAWGYNGYGALGNGNNTNSYVPVQVLSLTGITAVAAGNSHSLALKDDSTAWAWGYNNGGQLGNGNNIDTNLAVQVSSLTGVIAIAAGWGHSFAEKNDGTKWAWGGGGYGELGNGSNTNSDVPVKITALCCIPVTFTQSPIICAGQSITVGANTYTANGTYNDTLTAVSTCDSIVTTNLTVLPANTFSQAPTVCPGQSVTVGSNIYSISGTYYDTLTSLVNGCDSMITTNLTVQNMIDIATNTDGATITANQAAAVYQWIDCNNGNAPIASEINQSYTALVSGDYAVIVTVNSCSDTSACVNISTVGVSQLSNLTTQISVYPNPLSFSTTLLTDNLLKNATLTVDNCFGQTVKQIKNLNEQTIIFHRDNLPSGLYFLRLTQDSQVIATKKILIND